MNNMFASQDDIKYVLNNLRVEDKEEVYFLLGDDWYNQIIFDLADKQVQVIYGYDDNKNKVPIAIGGFDTVFPEIPEMACVWLLSTSLILKNKRIFFNELRIRFSIAEQKYKIMYNYIYSLNFSAKAWLKKFGFCFDNPYPMGLEMKENFEFFYKLVERGK